MGIVKRAAALGLGLSALLTASACMSSTAGDRLTKKVNDIDARVRLMEQNRERLSTAVTSSETQVARLEKVLNEATRVLTRNSADFGAQVQELQTQMGTLEGRLEEIRHGLEQVTRNLATAQQDLTARIDQMAKRGTPGGEPVLSPSDVPANKTEHYALAYRRFQERNWATSRALFREFVTRYPQDEQADNAQYWIGMSFINDNRANNGIGELRRVIEQYGESDAVDDAMFAMAEAFMSLHSCTDARTLYDALVRRFPNSTLAPEARNKLRTLRRPPAGMCST